MAWYRTEDKPLSELMMAHQTNDFDDQGFIRTEATEMLYNSTAAQPYEWY